MDPVNAAVTFMMIRLGILLPEKQVKSALLLLFGAQDKSSLMPALFRKFNSSKKLRNIYQAWLHHHAILPLQSDELYLIFGHAQVYNLSSQLRADLPKVEKALCELIPFMVRRYHNKSSLLKPFEHQI